MNTQTPKSIPHEVHLMILEFFLCDKGLYISVKKKFSYTSVSKWIRLSLVCRAWRNRIHTLVFHHLRVTHKALVELRDLAFSSTSPDLAPTNLGSVHTPTLNRIQNLFLSLETTDRLPDTLSILADLPHLNIFSIKLYINNERLDLDDSIRPKHTISQVKRLGITIFHPTCGICLEKTGVRWILSAFPSVEHLFLALPCTDDYSKPDLYQPHSLPPNLISLATTGLFPGLFGHQLAIPTLRFLEIWFARVNSMHPFANYHGNTLEGLRFVRMLAADHEAWDSFIPKFSSLRYLSIGSERRANLSLECIKSQHLRHFECNWGNLGYGPEALDTIVRFLTERCPCLQVVTYHDNEQMPAIEDLEHTRSLSVIRKPPSKFSTLEVSWTFFTSSRTLVYGSNRMNIHMRIPVGRIPYLPICPFLLCGGCMKVFLNSTMTDHSLETYKI